LLLATALVNAVVGLPLILAYLVSSSRAFLNRDDALIAILLLAKLAWMAGIYFFYKSGALFSFAQLVAIDLIFLVMLLVRKREAFFRGIAKPLFALFVLDALFNAWTLAFGSDPLGRVADARPDDFMPRLGGLFFHPFASINISLMAALFGLYLKRRPYLVLGIANVMVNGSYRGVLTLCVFAFAYFLIKRRTRFTMLLLCSLVAAAAVFGATIYSIQFYEGTSGNFYRAFAWLTAIDGISQSPIVGHHQFLTGELPEVSPEAIAEYGIAESTYLAYALHFGVVPAVLHFLILLTIFRRSVREYYRPTRTGSSAIKFAAALFACAAFIDTFYGTLIGGVFTSVCFGLFVFTAHHLREPRMHHEVGAMKVL
jgi:hypothetical protein